MIIDFILFFVINTIILGLLEVIYFTHLSDVDNGIGGLSFLLNVVVVFILSIYYILGLVLIIFQKLFCWDWYVWVCLYLWQVCCYT